MDARVITTPIIKERLAIADPHIGYQTNIDTIFAAVANLMQVCRDIYQRILNDGKFLSLFEREDQTIRQWTAEAVGHILLFARQDASCLTLGLIDGAFEP